MPEAKAVKSFVKGDAREVVIAKARGKGGVAHADRIRQGSHGSKATALTPKEAEFVKGKLRGKTNTQAALDAYNTDDPKTASVIASENLNKPRIKAAMAEALEKAGVTPKSMADVLREAMTATKTASMQGEVFASDEPDHSVRVSAVKAAVELISGSNDEDGAGNGKPMFVFNGGQTFVKNAEVHQS